MFSKSLHTSKPKVTGVVSTAPRADFHFGANSLFHLPNGLCLTVQEVKATDATLISLLNPLTHQCVVSTSLHGYSALCTRLRVVDNTIIVHYQRRQGEAQFLFLNATTLAIERMINASEGLEDFDFSALAMGGMKFLSLVYEDKNRPVLVMHNLISLTKARITLPDEIDFKIHDGDVGKLVALANNRFALHIAYSHSSKHEIIELDIDLTGKALTASFIRERSLQLEDFNPSARGCIVPLPDGRLLTYHSAGSGVEVWSDRERTAHWDWRQVACSNKDFFRRYTSYVRELLPMPDGVHLLMLPLFGLPCHLFNMNTKVLKPVELGRFDVYEASISRHGNVVMGGLEVSAGQASKVVKVVDFPELASYKASCSAFRDRILGLDFDEFKLIINDAEYWKTKGYNGSRLPKGLGLIQSLLKKHESCPPFYIAKFLEDCKQVAMIRLAEGNPAKRDVMTDHFYKIFIEDLDPANPSASFAHLEAIKDDRAARLQNRM
jgi:hypothetical protein